MAARVHVGGICSMASAWLSWMASHHARQRENRVRMIGNLLATRTPGNRPGEDNPFAPPAEGQPGFIRRFHRFRRLENKLGTRQSIIPRSQTPVWERRSPKLRFVSASVTGRNGVSEEGVPKREFGNEGTSRLIRYF